MNERPIRVLSADVANQIAAGEVIERPASVVKELVENALDAGAKRIVVEVKGGGKELIRVRDDGRGVSPSEATLVFERHATSKIEKAGDLITVQSLGFRGEALPSIASIARVQFLTRTTANDEGTLVEVMGTQIKQSVAGAPVGTQVSVYDLFYNTPARFKFLKTEATERRYIADIVTQMALAHSDVAFTLILEGNETLRTPGTGNLLETVAAVYGRKFPDDLIAVDWDSPWAVISGYVGKPAIAKGNRSAQSVFVNGRWVQNRLLSTAIEKGYESLLAHRRFPVAILNLQIDPTLIDVNVHPAKSEIRFKDERETFKAVMLSVRKALTDANLIVDIKSGSESPSDPETPKLPSEQPSVAQSPLRFGRTDRGSNYPSGDISSNDLSQVQWVGDARSEWVQSKEAENEAAASLSHSSPETPSDALDLKDPRTILRTAIVRGQVLNTYLMVPVPDGLWLIDQHVAHERILYEKVLNSDSTADEETISQPLLIPHEFSLSPQLAAALEEHRDFLASLGFIVESFGPRDFLLRAGPTSIKSNSTKQLMAILEELIHVFTDGGPTLREQAAAVIACRGAVKAGEVMAPEAMNHLVRELADVSNPFACPHGRPIILQLHRHEIERRFGRT